MSRLVSMNARRSHDDPATPELEVALLRISHPTLTKPIRLSTDPTERLSLEPLAYGTRSSWMTADPAADPFQFILVSALLPDDLGDAPATASLALDLVDRDMVAQLRAITDHAMVDLAVVMASSPDLVEMEQRGLLLVSASWNAASLTMELSRDPLTAEPWPSGRMTRERFPGLHP